MPERYRLPAEWEAQSTIQVIFPHAQSDWASMLEEATVCFIEIITTISRFEQVLVICDQISRVGALLKDAQQHHLLLVEIPSNDTWSRDYGGITILSDRGPIIWDFVFNAWGLKFPAFLDNQITNRLLEHGIFKNCTVKPAGMVLEGGAIESDGQGTILTTTTCQLSPNRNPHLSKDEIEALLRKRFGAKRILWLENGHLMGDDTDAHIDTLARFCDVSIIAYVHCDNQEDEHFTDLQAMEQELQAFRTFDGQPYRLIPLPWPDPCYAEDGHRLPATYANFLIINGAVLVPTYRVPQDQLALERLETCFPDREVIGIDCRVLIEQHGSLHCVTMQYPAEVELK